MKTYKDIMEVMSMKDMKDLGGTEAQKKIAQDRQRRREAKNRGMGNPNEKPTAMAAAADKKNTPAVQAPATPTRASAAKDPLAQAAPNVKPPTPPTKASAATDPLKRASEKGGALALRTSPADKGASIVRTNRGGTDKEAIGAPRKSGPGVRTSASERGTGTKTYDRANPERKRGGDLVKYKAPKPSKPGINYGAMAKKAGGAAAGAAGTALGLAGKGLRGAGRLAGKGVRAAVDANKASKKLEVAKGENLKAGETRMYGDERF